MSSSNKTPADASPSLGGARRVRDPRLWGALIGRDDRRREDAARTVRALGVERWYARELLAALPLLPLWQRPIVGDAVSLLGDLRFSPPYYLSEMVAVPAGRVILGSREYVDEQPVHRISVESFALSQMLVTQAAYAQFIAATKHRSPRGWKRGEPPPTLLNAPVVWISARDAEAYCRWLSAETGYLYRLPTEVEWVLAARGAESQTAYPWGDRFEEGRANLWGSHPFHRACAVGLFPEGHAPYGHEDMAGNVWEWCASAYRPYPYVAADGREDPASDEPRVMHGGSWRSQPFSARCAARQGEPPNDSFEVVGFRVARSSSHD